VVRPRYLALVVASLAMTAAAVLGVTGPANAVASHHIGNAGFEARCNDSPYLLCQYWYHGMNTGAYWGTTGNDANLIDNHFFSGTGQGAGEVVKNNATAMHCDFFVPNKCYSYFNSNYGGNFDWEWWQEIGTLYYTWNDNASVKIT
jgi:hypothetical protein